MPVHADLLEKALATMEAMPGWRAVEMAGLVCHSGARGLVFEQPHQDVNLTLCTVCLRAYLQVAHGVILQHNAGEERICARCKVRGPVSDFFSRNSFSTKYCSACRHQWGVAKRAEEKAAADAAAEVEAAEIRATLAARRRDLRELEREFGE